MVVKDLVDKLFLEMMIVVLSRWRRWKDEAESWKQSQVFIPVGDDDAGDGDGDGGDGEAEATEPPSALQTLPTASIVITRSVFLHGERHFRNDEQSRPGSSSGCRCRRRR